MEPKCRNNNNKHGSFQNGKLYGTRCLVLVGAHWHLSRNPVNEAFYHPLGFQAFLQFCPFFSFRVSSSRGEGFEFRGSCQLGFQAQR